MTAMPAIAGTRRLSWCWLPLSAAPAPARISSGNRKLKNAALGLRQNMRRSRRYWRQLRAIASGIGGSQLEVDVLERRASHGQLLEALAARERFGGELVEERGRVGGVALLEIARGGAVVDPVVGRADAELT